MSYLDGITLANKKNRVGKSKLEAELHQINREQCIEMRMHNNAKQRFKNRYSKLDVFDEKYGKDASDIIMYETHNPGFCYRRNGDCRLPQSNITSHSVDMQDLHMMLFTAEEIDIEKVVCLHLLTAHKTDTLSPPPKSQRTSFLTREQSPLERLIDRSKRKNFEVKLLPLPLYVLEVPNILKTEPLRDPRIMSKVIINEKLIQMVNSVITALEKSNTDKYNKFLQIIGSPVEITGIIGKARIRYFIRNLIGQNIISSCESFTLTTPARSNLIPLELGAPLLENLIRDIRRNILKLPSTENWKSFDKLNASTHALKLSANDNDADDVQEPGSSRESHDDSLMNDQTANQFSFAPSDEIVEFSLEYTGSDTTVDDSEYAAIAPQHRPKILRNTQQGFSDFVDYSESENTTVNNDDLECASCSKIGKESRYSFEILAEMLSKRVNKETKQDYKETMEQEVIYESLEDVTKPIIKEKCTLKQTRCNACMQKWKTPLPQPKTSKIKKLSMPELSDSKYNFTSKSAQKISDMINGEVARFETQDKAAPRAGSLLVSNRTYKSMARGSFVGNTTIEIVDLDELDLARIRQEIKENETKRKLTQFLEKS